MSDDDPFEVTSGGLARGAGLDADTARSYGDLGLLDMIRLDNGVRLFRRSAIEKARKLREDRVHRRGGRVA